MSSAQQVRFFNFRFGQVLDKITGSGSGSGQVGVLKCTIRYSRLSTLLLGISRYSWVNPDIPGYSSKQYGQWKNYLNQAVVKSDQSVMKYTSSKMHYLVWQISLSRVTGCVLSTEKNVLFNCRYGTEKIKLGSKISQSSDPK